MSKISESLFVVPMGQADPRKVRELSDELIAAYRKGREEYLRGIAFEKQVSLASNDDLAKTKL
jgi:hypothetical protein